MDVKSRHMTNCCSYLNKRILEQVVPGAVDPFHVIIAIVASSESPCLTTGNRTAEIRLIS